MVRAESAVAAPGRQRYGAAALVVAAACLWGTLGYFGRLLYRQGLTPLELASARATVAFLGLVLWFAPRPRRLRIRLTDLPLLTSFGLIGVAVFELVYFAAIERTSVALAAALLYTAPAFVVLLATVFERERLRSLHYVTLAVVLTGVFLVTGAARTLALGAAPLGLTALLLGLGSGLSYGLYTLLGKRAVRRYPPDSSLFWAFAVGSVALAIASPPWRIFAAHPQSWPLLLALGLIPTLAAYLLYLQGLRSLRASTASMIATIEPVVATLLGFFLLREALGGDQAVGIGLIVVAALLLARGDAPQDTSSGAGAS